MSCLHGQLIASIEDKAYHSGGVTQRMRPQALARLHDRRTQDESQAKEEQQRHKNRREIELPHDIVLECFEPGPCTPSASIQRQHKAMRIKSPLTKKQRQCNGARQ